jgi:hypothetical protein
LIALAVPDFPLVRELLAAGTLDADYCETTSWLAESAVALFPDWRGCAHCWAANTMVS